MSRPDPGATLERLSAASSVLCCALGLVMLAYWFLDGGASLASTGTITATPIAACLFVLSGAAVMLCRKQSALRSVAVTAIGGVVSLAGFLILPGYLAIDASDWQHWLDGLHQAGINQLAAAWMPAQNAIAFVFAGIAMILLGSGEKRYAAVQIIACLLIVFGYSTVAGYLCGFSPVYATALPSAMALIALAISLLFFRPQNGITAALLDDHAAGFLVRQSVPAALLIPLMLGLISVVGQQLGILEGSSDTLFLVVSTTIALLALLGAISHSIKTLDKERSRAEEQLRDYAGKLEEQAQILDLVHDTILVRNMDGRITFWNRGAEATYGFTTNDAVGKSRHELLKTKFPEPLDVIQTQLLKDGRWEGELTRTRSDGEQIIASSRWALKLNDAEEPVSIIESDTDITDQIRANERIKQLNSELERKVKELEQLNQELDSLNKMAQAARDQALEASQFKSQFLANMSHEIRTPVNGMLGMTEILSRTELESRQRGYIETIQEAGRSLLSVVNDILDFSKVEAGKLNLEIIPFEPVKVVETAGEILSAQARKKQLALQTFIDPEIPASLLGDPTRLRQILINLTSNAIKFSVRGEVTVKALLEHKDSATCKVRFSVSDQGIGMTSEQIGRLFQPFMQADGSTSRQYGGTGLGLAISQRFVQLMNGEIGVESEPGKGSTFWISIPFERADKVVVRQNPNLKGLRVLVVDDEPCARNIIHQYLLSWGVENGQASSGQTALEMLRSAASADPYQVAIVDLFMPSMTGLELARMIRQDGTIKDTNLILISASDTPGISEEANLLGFSSYLTKPIQQYQLIDCLSSVTGETKRSAGGKERVTKTQHGAPAPRPTPRSELILIAEDHPINQQVVLLMLRDLGFEAHIAESGEQVLEAVSQVPYALVFMDVQMPGMNGLDATKALRRLETQTGKHLPVVAVTAHALEGSKDECMAAGMDDYISKPIDHHELARIIEQYLPAHTPQQSRLDEESTANEEWKPSKFETLKRRIGADGAQQILSMFVTQGPAEFAILGNALRTGDNELLMQTAHRLQGILSVLGADDQLKSICRSIVKTGRAQNWSEATGLIHQLEHLFAQCIQSAKLELAIMEEPAGQKKG